MTDIIEFIHNRHSEAKLVEPAPAGDELESILQCALRAPDHALLRPWRYIVLEGEARERLGRAWADTMAAGAPESSAKALDKARAAPLRAPMVIAAVTRVQQHPKVPAIEQHLSTGVGMGYLLLALQARGFGGFWRTGDMAYHPRIREFLRLDTGEAITGFLYVGTPKAIRPALPMPALTGHVSYWN
jgi:nitroreductase